MSYIYNYSRSCPERVPHAHTQRGVPNFSHTVGRLDSAWAAFVQPYAAFQKVAGTPPSSEWVHPSVCYLLGNASTRTAELPSNHSKGTWRMHPVHQRLLSTFAEVAPHLPSRTCRRGDGFVLQRHEGIPWEWGGMEPLISSKSTLPNIYGAYIYLLADTSSYYTEWLRHGLCSLQVLRANIASLTTLAHITMHRLQSLLCLESFLVDTQV